MIAALILLLPLVAMQFTDEVIWDETDFAVIGVMLFGACGAYELAARMTGNIAYRAAVGVAVVAAFILIWINLAVGIIGSEDNPANLMYGGVLAVGILGALIVRFQPHGMARALAATALVQALVGVIAMIAGLGSTGANWPEAIVVLTGFLRRAVAHIGLAVSESGAGANFRGRSAVSSACNIRKDGDAARQALQADIEGAAAALQIVLIAQKQAAEELKPRRKPCCGRHRRSGSTPGRSAGSTGSAP